MASITLIVPTLAAAAALTVFGKSIEGRPLEAQRVGAHEGRPVLVVGCIHGDECAGLAVVRVLARSQPRGPLWLVWNLNPDGYGRRSRWNARGVDLNRNFASEWSRSPEAGTRPFSEPETRAVRDLIVRLRPRLTIWFHQPQALVRAWGRSASVARRYARLARMPYRSLRWPPGTASNWQNHRGDGGRSFVVELAPGPLDDGTARRHARAVLSLAAG